jgi:integrase
MTPEGQGTAVLQVTSAGSEIAALANQAQDYIRAAKARATLRAYQADWRHFEAWCNGHGLATLPATPDTVALYLADLASTHRPATLTRRLTSINKAHRAAGHAAPALMEHLPVSETLKGIRRTHGTHPNGKRPLFTADLCAMIAKLPAGLAGVRDRALLLVGFAGGLRRSELAALEVTDVELTKEGLVLRVRHSKSDPEGRGREVAIPYGSVPETCPVRACGEWMAESAGETGPLFRPIDRHGNMGSSALHRDSIGLIVKRAVRAAGLDERLYAGHSLRAGLCTQSYMNGARELDIMRQTGHRSLETVRRYIRGRGLFRDNPAAKLGL